MDLGINPRNAVLTKFDLSPAGYTAPAAERFQRQLLQTVSHLPGVEAAAYANTTPLADTVTTAVYSQQTTDFRPSNKVFESYYFDVSPGYFAAAQTPLIEGRDIRETDTATTPRVAVVNQEFARQLFHTEHAVGRYFKNSSGQSIQVVGIAAEGKYFLTSEDPDEAVFFPILQRPDASVSLIVRTRPDPTGGAAADMAATIRKTIRALDPAIPIRLSSPWYSALSFSFFPAQVATVALGVFGAFGLLLSITGTFGLASYTVSKRLRELSIRVALGAQGKQILSAALGRMLSLLAVGSLIGMLLGVATSHILSAIVYQASANDPFVLFAVACTAFLTASLSVANPVWRVLHVDPALLLRDQ
jgi:ABC-type antimicrobial peptide transport system permease subunit